MQKPSNWKLRRGGYLDYGVGHYNPCTPEERDREKWDVAPEAEVGATGPKAQDCLEPPEAGGARRKDPPQNLQRECNQADSRDADLELVVCRTKRKLIFVVKPSGLWEFVPETTDTDTTRVQRHCAVGLGPPAACICPSERLWA